MLPFSADRAMVAKFDAAILPFMSKLDTMGDGVKRFQVQSQVGFTDIDNRATRTGQALVNLRSTAAGLGMVFGTLAAGLASGAFISMADDAKLLENQMRGIGIVTDDVRKQVYALAIETRTPVAATVELLSRMQKSLQGQPIEQTIRQVGTLNRLLAIAGLDGNARASVSLQFGQALQSGILQGDELRSLREAAPYELLDAIAKAAGGTVAELRKLGEEGKITRSVMTQALDDLEKVSKDKFGAFNMMVGEAAETMRTGLLAVVGELDEGLGATSTLSAAMSAMATFMLDNAGAANVLGQALKVVAQTALLVAGARGIMAIGSAAMAANLSMGTLAAAGARVTGVFRVLMSLAGGPVGLALAALGGAAIYFSGRAAEARENADAVNVELERMGLYSAPKAADGLDEAAKGLDKLSDPKRLEMIKRLREETERLRTGGRDMFGRAAEDTPIGIAERARHEADYGWMASDFESVDDSALRQIEEMARAVNDSRASLEEVQALADQIAATDVSIPAKQLASALVEVVKRQEAAIQAQLNLGDSQTVRDDIMEQETARLKKLEHIVQEMREAEFPPEVAKEIKAATGEIISMAQALIEGKTNIEDVRQALDDIASVHPEAEAYVARLSPIFEALSSLIARAAETRNRLAEVAAGSAAPTGGPAFEDKGRQGSTHAPYIAPPKTLDDLIKENSSKGGGGGGGGGGSKNSYKEAIANVDAETEALRRQAKVLLEVADARGVDAEAMEFAAKKAELLNAAHEAGTLITPAVLADIDARAAAYAREKVALDGVQQAQDDMAQKAASGKDFVLQFFTDSASAAADLESAIKKALIQLILFNEGALAMPGGGKGLLGGIGGGFMSFLGGFFANGGVMTPQGARDLPLRAYANGGIANSPQLAVFGEGRNPEAYVPLPDGRTIPVTLDMPDLSGVEAALRERSGVQVIYVPQPYVATVSADDDGKIMGRMQMISDASAGRMGNAINKALPARIADIQKNPRRG